MSDTHLEDAAKVLKEALKDDNHVFWTKFGQEREGHETLDELREHIQEEVDNKRRKKELEPRSWDEIEKELEEVSNRGLDIFHEDLMQWNNQQRKTQGLEPRSKEEMMKDMKPKISGLLHDVIYRYDTQKRNEKGLPPRLRDEFEKMLKDGPGSLGQ
ncbi:MAG: hypothetical protein Q9196_004590 [Gyalolechia fulgens]